MKFLKRLLKQHSHSPLVAPFAGLGRSINRFYENRSHDHYCNGEFMVLRKLSQLNPGVIFDVGANVGEYTIYAKKVCPKASIYSFEPVTNTYNELQDNLNKHGIKDVQTIKKALTNSNGTLKINTYNGSAHSTLHQLKGVNNESVGVEEIDSVIGDQFMKTNQIDFVDFLKLDIEGSEMDALKGFEEALRNKRIKIIQFEYGYINISTRTLLCDFYEFLGDMGYDLGKIYPRKVEFRKYDFKHEDFMGPNYLAIDNSDRSIRKFFC